MRSLDQLLSRKILYYIILSLLSLEEDILPRSSTEATGEHDTAFSERFFLTPEVAVTKRRENKKS